MIDQWVSALGDVVNMLLGTPGSDVEKYVIAGVTFLVMVLVLARAGTAFGIANADVFHSLMTTLLGVLLIVISIAAAKIYCPEWSNPNWHIWVIVGSAVLVSVFIVVPLMCLFQKTGFIPALLTWLIGVGAAAAIIVMVGAGFDMASAGQREAGKEQQHKSEMNDFLNK